MIVLKWYISTNGVKHATLYKDKKCNISESLMNSLVITAQNFFGSYIATGIEDNEISLEISEKTPKRILNDSELLINCLSDFFTEALPYKNEFELLPF